MNLKKDIFWRVYLSFFLIFLAGIAIMVQVFRIQHVQGEHYRAIADSVSTRFNSIEPVRGNILSSDGRLMAASMPVYELRMDPNAEAISQQKFYNNVDSLSWHLANYFGDRSQAGYREYLVNARESGNRYLFLRRRVNHHQLKDIKEFPLFREGRFRGGLIVERRTARLNPFRKLARRTVGYHTEHIRPVGIEGAFNDYLSGKEGKRLMQRVAGGTWIPINDENELEPEDGKDVVTTIDINIQDVTKQALVRQLKEHNAHHGTAVVMEVSTGRIKAIANLKKSQRDGEYRELYNYAVGESAEPGSTFKLASVLALLEKAGIDPGDSIDTEDGSIEFYDRTMRDHDPEGFGKITLKEAMGFSSNVAISKLIHENFGSNPEAFTSFLREIGIDKPLHIPIAGEGAPLIKSPSDGDWSGTTLPWMSIGYEVKMTPLQMLTFYNAVANEGKMVKPMFVDRIMDVGRIYRNFDTEVINPAIASSKTIENVGEMLRHVVEDGTASNLKTPNYSIAGKTGTALIASPDGYGREQDKIYQSSFAGYFPAENPLYSMVVVINDPSEGVYNGSQVAGPVFREISDKIFANNLQLHKAIQSDDSDDNDEKQELLFPSQRGPAKNDIMTDLMGFLNFPFEKQQEGEWLQAEQNDSLVVMKNANMEEGIIPDVRGMVLSDAVYLLEKRGLNVKANGTGKVVSQSVIPGTRATEGRQIVLTLN